MDSLWRSSAYQEACRLTCKSDRQVCSFKCSSCFWSPLQRQPQPHLLGPACILVDFIVQQRDLHMLRAIEIVQRWAIIGSLVMQGLMKDEG